MVIVAIELANKNLGIFTHEIRSFAVDIDGHDFIDGLAIGRHSPFTDPGEIGGKLVKLFAFPDIRGMIMAIGALQLDPKKDAASLGSHIFRPSTLGKNQRCFRMFFNIPQGGQHRGNGGIPPKSLIPAGRHPRGELFLIGTGALFGCPDVNHIPPVAGPIESKFG